MKLTEKQYKDFLNKINKNLNHKENKKSSTNQSLGIEVQDNIINYNKKSTIEVSYNDSYISIIFHNAKLLSTNQIFQILQYRKYEIFSYKKMWQELVHKSLKDLENIQKFKDNC